MSSNTIICICRIVFLWVIFTTVVALAEDFPEKLEDLERYEASRIAEEGAINDQVSQDTVLQQFNLQALHTKLACIKAVGHAGFCHCISEHMPTDQEFSNYVVAVSKTKNELNFDQLSEYYQGIVKLARSARDKCVAENM